MSDAPDFNPYMIYNMTTKELRALLLKTPHMAFWNGRTYSIKSKHLGVGVYEVTGKFND